MSGNLPRYVETHRDRFGVIRFYFRIGHGPRIRLDGHPASPEFKAAYAAALAGEFVASPKPKLGPAAGTIGALITSYMRSRAYTALRDTTKRGYRTPLETLRKKHGHRSVSGLTRDRIETGILQPYSDRPGAQLALLKILRVVLAHARTLDKGNPLRLSHDPSDGIARPKGGEIRAWTEAELARFEARWPLGTKQRTAYALMLYSGTARTDVHRITWAQVDVGGIGYTRNKTGVPVEIGLHSELQKALAAAPRQHVTILNTEYGRPFSVTGFGNFMRSAIDAAGLPATCKPHGLRKTLGRRMADAGCTAHEIMAVLGHKSLQLAEHYSREADRRRGGRSAVLKLDGPNENSDSQTASGGLGKTAKQKGKST
ncbi:MAG: hypothetical protein QOF19_3397 [Alphaproteobacteria bacterium]|jgi:integrase|nr:hypothetical protein [Alphaproteobacteria bacterium]